MSHVLWGFSERQPEPIKLTGGTLRECRSELTRISYRWTCEIYPAGAAPERLRQLSRRRQARMILVSTLASGGRFPLPNMSVRTGSNRVAAQEAAARAKEYGKWDDVGINFNDGSRPMRGVEVRQWVERHFPEVIA